MDGEGCGGCVLISAFPVCCNLAEATFWRWQGQRDLFLFFLFLPGLYRDTSRQIFFSRAEESYGEIASRLRGVEVCTPG